MDSITLPKAIFFDWDGTLVDSYEFLLGAHNHVRGVFGFGTFSSADFSNYFGKPRDMLYAEIYGPENMEQAKAHFEEYVIANQHKIQPLPGAETLLETICSLDIPMGVVTNKKGDLVRREIPLHGWEAYFISVVGAGEAEADKPSAAPLLLALDRSDLGLAPQDIWYIGDTDNDLKCAAEAGAPSVLITNNEDQSALIATHSPALVFQNCTEFADFLLQSAGNSLKQEANTA